MICRLESKKVVWLWLKSFVIVVDYMMKV
jgi:hypothetical protein